MKKLTIITTGLMMFLSTAVFANEGEKKSKKAERSALSESLVGRSVTVNRQVSESFTAKFTGAEKVSWKQNEEFYFAEFKLNQKDMFAAYNAEGELLGVSRNLELSQVPLHVEMSIREKYKDYRIANNVTEVVLEGGTTYYLHAESKTRILKLECDSYGQVYVAERTKKKLVGSVY